MFETEQKKAPRMCFTNVSSYQFFLNIQTTVFNALLTNKAPRELYYYTFFQLNILVTSCFYFYIPSTFSKTICEKCRQYFLNYAISISALLLLFHDYYCWYWIDKKTPPSDLIIHLNVSWRFLALSKLSRDDFIQLHVIKCLLYMMENNNDWCIEILWITYSLLVITSHWMECIFYYVRCFFGKKTINRCLCCRMNGCCCLFDGHSRDGMTFNSGIQMKLLVNRTR